METLDWIIEYIYEWRKYNYYVGTLLSKYLYFTWWDGVWWNKIDENVTLGAIPLHNLDHLEMLKNENIGAILCVLEDFEMTPTLYFRPVSKSDWEENNITFLQLPAEDSYGVKLENIIKSLSYIFDNIKNKKKTYIHCKMGVGRSASIVLCYMLRTLYEQHGSISKDDVTHVYEQLKTLRNEIHINTTQMMPVYEYVDYLSHCK